MGGEMKTASVLLGEESGTISDLIHAHACERPAAVALVEGDERISYGQLDQLMDRVATALQNDGLRTGDIVDGAVSLRSQQLVWAARTGCCHRQLGGLQLRPLRSRFHWRW